MGKKKDELLMEIIRMGHPLLRQAADAVSPASFGTPALRAFGDRLIHTMIKEEGVGLAAPQVGESLRCFAYYIPIDREPADSPAEPEEEDMLIKPRVLVNPQIKPLSTFQAEGWEGCLSIPGLRGLVPRYTHIEVNALDVEGNKICFEAEDFHARVIQHEYDHLDGILFLDRMEHMRSLAFEEEWLEYVVETGDE